jgi:hypothetical protein
MRKLAWTPAVTAFVLFFTTVGVAAYFLISYAQGQRLFWEGHAVMNRGEYDYAVDKLDAALQKRLTYYYRT